MRVALVHFWLVADRGGEKVLSALCKLFPQAVIFTHVADEELVKRLYPDHEVRTTFISKLPFSKTQYQKYLPLMPMALEGLDLSEFDLVISSESGPAKGVIPRPDARHICYCHSPMRYIWDQYHLYRREAGMLAKLAMPYLAHRMRQWDVTSSARVDDFLANSNLVAQRIEKYYRRTSTVVPPPVAVDDFNPSVHKLVDPQYEDAYLWVGQLVSYKRPDLAVAAFNRLGKKLLVIGEGEQLPALRQQAGPTVTFAGRTDFKMLQTAYASCRALIFPGEEDFGIVPVEAMASGTPVIAYGRGGALDTIVPDQTGVLFQDQTVEGLVQAVERFEAEQRHFSPAHIIQHTQQFNEAAFRRNFLAATGMQDIDPPLNMLAVGDR